MKIHIRSPTLGYRRKRKWLYFVYRKRKTILDPFAGAGTTVLAAVQEGYEAVGIEMSDAYFQRSAERLKTALESEVNQN